MDDSNLPAAYGKTRLVLLVVDPYIIHVYWEVAPEKLREAKQQAREAKAVLRFYKGSKTANEDALPDSFDIEIDLPSCNWYVRLWSPEESLYADLALKKNDGTVIRLVRSQVVHMPRTRPAIAIDQRFMRVEATERRAEIVPSPPAGHGRPQEGTAPLRNEVHVRPILRPMDTAEIVREKLEDLYASVQWSGRRLEYASVQWSGRRLEPETVRALEISTLPPGRAGADLTAIAERSLAAGLSSGALQKSRLEGGPDTTK